MTANDQPDLLFFDTFSHDTSEELNLDLVQFPKSVFVREIRIIPLGARVEGDFPGGVRLGATNPTKFHIDFFVNDLSKPGASTFESLGSLDYCQNGQIHVECATTEPEQTRIPTDGLVLRGWYTTITLAVYGNLTVVADTPPAGLPSPHAAPPTPKQALPRALTPGLPTPSPSEWPEPPNPIPTYTGNVATVNPEVYGPNYPPENYDNYRGEYYETEPPKDPRTYHMEGQDWDKDRQGPSGEREVSRLSPRSEHDRDRERRDGRSRRRSLDRRSRESSRPRSRDRLDRLHSRSRSRDRDFIVKGEYRPPSRSRSRSLEGRDRMRGISSERDWDRSSYKKDDYRRHRDSSYERSRAGSYDKRSGSFERRGSPYDRKRASSYDKRGSSYERRPSYERQPYDKKRHSPYSRIRSASYNSRSPSRDDPRKRPRTPPSDRNPISPGKGSPNRSVHSEDGEYDRSGKQIPRVEFYQSYRHKTSIRSPSQEAETAAFAEVSHSSLVTVPLVENTSPKPPESPIRPVDDDKSMDAEQFEPILSDEDICDDLEGPAYLDVNYDVNEYCGVDDIIKYYNPFKSEWVQYQNVNKVQLLASDETADAKDVLKATFDELCDVNSDLFKISELTKTAKGREQKFIDSTFTEIDNVNREEWVHQCEQTYVSVTNLCKSTDIMLRIFSEVEKTDEFTDIRELLVTFCKIGLNFDYALAQQQPTYKIRHMKCGIRLAEALMAHKHNSKVMTILLKAELDIPMLLLEMYSKEYMALSIRLMILRALNACLSSKESIEHFMKETIYPKFGKNDNEFAKPKNGYQALISIMQTNPLARIKFSVSALIKKLNIYELFTKVHELVLKFNKEAADRDGPSADDQADDVELTEDEIDFVVDAMEQLLHMYKTQCFHISQPKRFLPASAQFEISKDSSNETLLEFFNIHHILEVCLYLLTCPITCNNPVVVSPIHDLIHELVYSQNGLKYLYKNMKMSELVFKTLVQPYGQQNSEEFMFPHDLSSYSDLQILGLELAYRLKALYYLHSICDLQAGKVDENELIDRLQSLYCLSFGSIGRTAVPDVITMNDNAECLMEVFERDLKSRNKNESPSKQKSPAKGYAIELIVLAVRFSAHVPFLKKYGPRILNVARDHDRFEPSVSSVLQEVVPYLKPVDKSSLIAGEDLAECVEILKSSAEHAPDLPGELTTCLRVLRHFCISDYDANVTVATESATDEYVELKYKYNVLQLFSLDGVAHLTGILERITTHFEQPSMHTAFFASVKGLQLAQMLVPCLRLLDEMLARVVRCRGSRFRDLTAAPVLLKTYGLVKTFPAGCVGYRAASRAAEAAVRALLAYSQPIADDAADGDSIRRGPWTSLCSEVISYTMTAPYTFVPGLLVFSELLPLPLPMHTKIPPTERELADAANERRMWSAHLYALSNDLIDMIQIICMSTYRPVVHMLRRVCVQIADLAPNTAATVARAAVGAVTREVKPSEPASASAQRVLGFLACLVAHAPVKCAVLHAINSGGPKALDLPTAFCSVLNLSHASSDHATAQELVAHALAGLCDIEVTLTPLTAQSDVLLANSLPNKETLATMLDATVNCLESPTRSCAVAASILRTFYVLTDHEFGFQQFVRLVSRRRESLGRFFRWCCDAGDDRAECLALLLELARVLKAEEGEGPAGRRCTLSVQELACLLGYEPGDEDHPALRLDAILRERNTDDDVVSNAVFIASQLREFCGGSPSGTPPVAPPVGVPPLPVEETTVAPPEPLARQFAARWTRAAAHPADERLTSSYWLTVPQDDPDTELVPCDIVEIAASQLSGGWESVAASVRRLAGAPDHREPAPKHDPRPTVSLTRPRTEGCLDAFRSRPPNTSRPPSLHVDDFTALAHPPALPYGKPPPPRGMRRGIAVADRGRFASSTPHYRHLRGRGAWEMGAQHFGHFPPTQYMMGGWGGGRAARGPRHRAFMR